MVVVIADDLTGAAELAGIGVRNGLEVVIADHVDGNVQPELLVIYTNTRSLGSTDAVRIMEGLSEKLKSCKPLLVYKKIDSVLRGHVIPEVKAQMKILDKKRALLIPANPALGRKIINGKYFVHGRPIHETGFANDPEFPVRSSQVKDMLGNDAQIISPGEELLQTGIMIGEAATTSDLEAWAKRRDPDVLFGGGSGYFSCLLERLYPGKGTKETRSFTFASPLLLVSGTTYPANVERIRAKGKLVSYIPREVTEQPGNNQVLMTWKKEIIYLLQENGKALIAVGDDATVKDQQPELLRRVTSEVVFLVLNETRISELLIEGGSTAYSIISRCGFNSFIPEQEIAPGVIRMLVMGRKDFHITIKPGSYEWPAEWDI